MHGEIRPENFHIVRENNKDIVYLANFYHLFEINR